MSDPSWWPTHEALIRAEGFVSVDAAAVLLKVPARTVQRRLNASTLRGMRDRGSGSPRWVYVEELDTRLVSR